jgi:thiosulfate/3-mercaptopyruvate sulfurtransferase
MRRRFTARYRRELVTALEDVRRNLETRKAQVVDARSAGRFAGTEPEPRPGLRSGRIPGSLNLSYDRLFRPDGALLAAGDLRRVFEDARVDLSRPVATTCGSGVSACVLALGLHLAGRPDVSVYDGSWAEWGGREDVPVER